VPLAFDNSYARLPDRFYARVLPTPVSRPLLLAYNASLASTLGLTNEEVESNTGIEIFAGNLIPEGAEPIALAYAGHQFGGFVPQLGDGRAILLGEIDALDGQHYDLQLKGSGRTPFSRNGDGRAALGPVLREYLLSEAMAKLGVPTTRALVAVTTGEFVERETPLPGAVLTRVALSHLRIGTFQYFAARRDHDALKLLVDYALVRLYPNLSTRDSPAIQLLDAVLETQAAIVAKWQAIGFVHGVMNTDNMSISGETIDYGPCAFLDAFDPERTFSSIDRRGRYRFANQPHIAHYNLTCLAEALRFLVNDNAELAASEVNEHLSLFPRQFRAAYSAELRRKLGLLTERDSDWALAQELLEHMATERVDYTQCFYRLSQVLAPGDDHSVLKQFSNGDWFRDWIGKWRHRLAQDGQPHAAQYRLMRQSNPVFIPRNHRVQEAINAATVGDLAPFERLHATLDAPYTDQPEATELMLPPGDEQWSYQTFCGT
jgi:uncharacterized protein YdiU (UPF0061 family)